MTVITLGTQEIGLKASPLALLFYKQEFKSDLVGDLIKFAGNIDKDLSKIDTVVLLQMMWAMAKAANGLGKAFPPFAKWLEGLDGIDFTDLELMDAVIKEAENGFFRGARGVKPTGK